MAKISNQSAYPLTVPTADDYLIGTDDSDSFVTKNFAMADVSTFVKSQLSFGAALVLSASNTNNQIPTGLDTPLQVKFGPAQNTGSDPVSLDANGVITFNQAGLYLFTGYANFERQGSSGGVTVTLFRPLFNSVQSDVTKMVELNQTGVSVPYEISVPLTASVGDVLTYEILRDSSGVDQGGLYSHVNSSSWSDVPAVSIKIFKVGI